MNYGWTGVNLEVDLSRGSIEKEEWDPRLAEDFLGGKGTSIKILWDRVSPEVERFSPDNLLIFSAPVLVGTLAPAANRTIVSTVSPPTNLHAYCAMGGFWGQELKHAGYDKVIVRGKSPTLVYLWINDDKIEIRDASHLRGIGTVETEDLIRKELNQPNARVTCIGAAGENRVYQSTIESGGSSASRGCGVIMGDKKLKAIAVRGTKDINIARPAEFIKLCEEALGKYEHVRKSRGTLERSARTLRIAAGLEEEVRAGPGSIFRAGNVREGLPGMTREQAVKDTEFLNKVTSREIACYNCPVRCRTIISIPGFGVAYIKCGSGNHLKNAARLDTQFNHEFFTQVERYGMDTHWIGQTLAFGLELRDAGILTKEETEGMPSETREAFFWLADKIAHREGIGDALADGQWLAARRIGRGAEAYAHNCIKGVEQEPVRSSKVNPTYLIMYSTGDQASITQHEIWYPQRTAEFRTRESREAYIKEGWWDLPESFQKWFLEWRPRGMTSLTPASIEEAIHVADYGMHIRNAQDICGFCGFWSGFEAHPVYSMSKMAELISCATGMDVDRARLEKTTRRIETLIRAFNVRLGLKREDEKIPDDFYRDREPELEAKVIDDFYKFKGLDSKGIPTKETLEELGLDYAREDLERRGILTNEKS